MSKRKPPFKDQFVSGSDHEQYERDIYDRSSWFGLKWLGITVAILLAAFVITLIINLI